MDTQSKGNVAESKAIARFIELGYEIYTPFGESSGADFIADNGQLKRVQVKSSFVKEGCVACDLRRTNMKSGGVNHTQYQSSEVDLFAIYSPEQDEIYCVPFEDAPDSKMKLRIEEAERNYERINWASEYVL